MVMNRIPNLAALVVQSLLEDVAGSNVSCAGCEHEFGVRPAADASHAYCKRHLLQMYDQRINMAKEAMGTNPNAAGSLRQLMAKVNEIKARPDNTFAPDLSKQRQQPQQQPAGQGQQQYAGVAQ